MLDNICTKKARFHTRAFLRSFSAGDANTSKTVETGFFLFHEQGRLKDVSAFWDSRKIGREGLGLVIWVVSEWTGQLEDMRDGGRLVFEL